MENARVGRRAFARALAAGAAVLAPLGPAPLLPAAADDPEAPALTPSELVLQLVQAHYPDRLEPEHLSQIRQHIERHQALARVLHDYPLTNADEPATLFAAWRAPE
jgi:hypothetical protein